MTGNNPPELHVAVGVLTRPDGRVLLAERPAGKVMAGYWEFPGGKIEPGEAAADALARELHEELGIDIEAATPWITRTFRYAHAIANLHLFRITGWQGEPHGRESQRLSWQDPHCVDIAPLLPANHDIMDALRLPALYAITQAGKLGVEVFMERLRRALEHGVRLVQVREKEMDRTQLERFAAAVSKLCHDHGACVMINGATELARQTGADGVHLQTGQYIGCTQPPVTDLLWAASCHDRDELQQAARLGAAFAVLSPVLPTASHPGAPTLGWDGFASACAGMPMPVYALGGMRTDMLDTARAHNAHGIALLSGIW
ncbi:MAG: Nudix family hydrolase [Pseudomonadota bacterium]